MTTPAAQADPTISAAFISQARYLQGEEYLPKIERCLEQLTDQQVWWRANESSNSIGNLILHISGNARQWIACGLGGEPDDRKRDAEFAERRLVPRGELLAHLKSAVNDVDRTLEAFDGARLLDQFQIQSTTFRLVLSNPRKLKLCILNCLPHLSKVSVSCLIYCS